MSLFKYNTCYDIINQISVSQYTIRRIQVAGLLFVTYLVTIYILTLVGMQELHWERVGMVPLDQRYHRRSTNTTNIKPLRVSLFGDSLIANACGECHLQIKLMDRMRSRGYPNYASVEFTYLGPT